MDSLLRPYDKDEFDAQRHPKIKCYLVMDDVIHFQCTECHDILLLHKEDYPWSNIISGETLVLIDGKYWL